MPAPFVLLDDARVEGASDARLYRNPEEVIVARRPHEVAAALARLDALAAEGAELAGYVAYEAGLVIEPRLQRFATPRCGAAGPLVWFGRFASVETIRSGEVPGWLQRESAEGKPWIAPLAPQVSLGGYAQTFDALLEAILGGDIYQANFAFQLAGSWGGDPLALYAAIRPHAAAGHGGVVFDGSHWLLSFSPELFVAVKDRAVTMRPMKGTRPRAADARADAAMADELEASTKDRAENLMIVDLVRNDLSRIAEPGSVRVERAFAIESFPTVHQMTSTVRAQLPESARLSDLMAALFPCGSITGAPKIRAMELIEALERDARGPYCGAIGRIAGREGGSRGPHPFEAAFNVAIRTLRLDPASGRASLGVGSAVVAESTAVSEWRECLVKGDFVARSAAASFDLIETMRFEPERGVALLDLHLERMAASAAELGFAFDRHAARNTVHALCFDQTAPAKVRLLLAKSGAQSVEVGPLPAELPQPAVVAALPLPLAPGDWRLRHKISDREWCEAGRRAAEDVGANEAIFVRDDGLVTEGSFSNVFVEREGELATPPLALGLLPGVLRRRLLDEGRAIEGELTLDDLTGGFLIGNAVRGLIPARLLGS